MTPVPTQKSRNDEGFASSMPDVVCEKIVRRPGHFGQTTGHVSHNSQQTTTSLPEAPTQYRMKMRVREKVFVACQYVLAKTRPRKSQQVMNLLLEAPIRHEERRYPSVPIDPKQPNGRIGDP